jgi:hypothetical protein
MRHIAVSEAIMGDHRLGRADRIATAAVIALIAASVVALAVFSVA